MKFLKCPYCKHIRIYYKSNIIPQIGLKGEDEGLVTTCKVCHKDFKV